MRTHRALERLTRPLNKPRADDGCGQFQQRLVDVQSSFKTDAQLSKAGKPRMGSLHDPAMLAQTLATFYAPSGNPA